MSHHRSIHLYPGAFPTHSPLGPTDPRGGIPGTEEDGFHNKTGTDDLDHQSEVCGSRTVSRCVTFIQD